MTKTIITTVTLSGPDASGVRAERPPGTAVTLEADEADGILARFGGSEVTDDEAASKPPKKGRTAKPAD